MQEVDHFELQTLFFYYILKIKHFESKPYIMKFKNILYILIFLNLTTTNLFSSEEFEHDSAFTMLSNEEKIYFNKGLSFKKDGKWQEAITQFNKVIKLNPKSSESYYHIGIIYEYQLKYPEAINSFHKASRLDSKYAFYAGLDLENLGRWDEAISSFKSVLRDYPGMTEARFHLGLSYKKKKMLLEAISEFKKILAQDKNHAGSVYNLAIIYKKLGMMNEAKREALEFNSLTFSKWTP